MREGFAVVFALALQVAPSLRTAACKTTCSSTSFRTASCSAASSLSFRIFAGFPSSKLSLHAQCIRYTFGSPSHECSIFVANPLSLPFGMGAMHITQDADHCLVIVLLGRQQRNCVALWLKNLSQNCDRTQHHQQLPHRFHSIDSIA